jgi:hypothetical protein
VHDADVERAQNRDAGAEDGSPDFCRGPEEGGDCVVGVVREGGEGSEGVSAVDEQMPALVEVRAGGRREGKERDVQNAEGEGR